MRWLQDSGRFMLKCFRFSLSNRPPFPQAPDGPSAAFKWSSRSTAFKSPLRGFKVRWFQVLGEGRASARPRPPAGQHGARGGTGTRRVVLRLACALLHPPHPDGPARDVPAPPRRVPNQASPASPSTTAGVRTAPPPRGSGLRMRKKIVPKALFSVKYNTSFHYTSFLP